MKCSCLEVGVPEAGRMRYVVQIREMDDLGEGLEVVGTRGVQVESLEVVSTWYAPGEGLEAVGT